MTERTAAKESKKRVVFICPDCHKISEKVHEVWKSEFVDDCSGLDKWGEIEKVSAGVGDSDSEFQHTTFGECDHDVTDVSSENCAIIINPDWSWKRHNEFDITEMGDSEIDTLIKEFLNGEFQKKRRRS